MVGNKQYLQSRFRVVYNKLRKTSKELYQLAKTGRQNSKSLLFIIGCQRSGTTLMTTILEKDWNAKVYLENSRLSLQNDGEDRLRLKPLAMIRQVVEQERFPLVVLKPLVETQNAAQLLEYFPNSRAIWMYRHYKDVAYSNLNRFGLENGINNLRYIVENEVQNWRAENVPEWVRRIVLAHFSEIMNPYDAAALFWYVRNTFFFELTLDLHPRVMTCKYDELATFPGQTMKKIYHFINQPYPGDHILKGILASSVGKGQRIILSEEIENLCEQLWSRFGLTTNRLAVFAE